MRNDANDDETMDANGAVEAREASAAGHKPVSSYYNLLLQWTAK